MFIAIWGFGAIFLGLLTKSHDLTMIGFGFIALDIALELSTLNTNLKVLIQNTRVLFEKTWNKIEDVKK